MVGVGEGWGGWLGEGCRLKLKKVESSLQMVGRGGKRLVIVNLQATPLDYACKLRIFAKCDEVSKMLMSKLGLEIPEFRLKRYEAVYMHGHTRANFQYCVYIQYRRVVIKTVTESGKVTVSCFEA